MSKIIRVSANVQDLINLLSKLELTENYMNNIILTLDVEVKETKNNYVTLSTSKLNSWDFIEDNSNVNIEENSNLDENNYQKESEESDVTEEIKEEEVSSNHIGECSNNECSLKDKDLLGNDDEYIKIAKHIENLNFISYVDILRFVYSVWEVKSNLNPEIKFNLNILTNIIIPKYYYLKDEVKLKFSTELEFVVSSYYFGISPNDTMISTSLLKKINSVWDYDYMSDFKSFKDLINKLYNENGLI